MFFYRPLFFILTVSVVAGCASITNRHQYVRVVPPDTQTEIHYDNEKVGTGATTVHLTRSKRPKLTFIKGDQKQNVQLKTSYRWGQSFAGNIFLYPYTPIGWLVDYMTGASWETVDRIDKSRKYQLNTDSRLLILPTTRTNSVDSRFMGRKVQKWLAHQRPELFVLPFEKTYSVVVGMGFDNESAALPEDADSFNELLHKEKVTHLVFSDYDSYAKEIQVHIYSPYNEKVVKRYTIPNVESEVSQSNWFWFYTELFDVVPNTVSLGTQQTFYGGCAVQPDGVLRYCADRGTRSALSFLSNFSLTSVLHFRKRTPWSFYFRFYPDFNISYNQVEFDKAEASLEDLKLDWVFISLGYGPRMSFILPVGELFLEVSPFVATNYLRLYSDQNYDQTQWVGKTGVTAQFGLNSWIANHWNMRFFAKIQSQNLLENQDISNLDPDSQFAGGLTIVQSGFSIGYYFHEEKSLFFDWLNLFDK